MNRYLIGFFFLAVAGIVALAATYPDQFVLLLVGLVIGFGGGMLVSTTLMKSYFNQGANMVHELQKKQISNPVSIMREARLAEKEEAKNSTPIQQNQAIPRIRVTGLNK